MTSSRGKPGQINLCSSTLTTRSFIDYRNYYRRLTKESAW